MHPYHFCAFVGVVPLHDYFVLLVPTSVCSKLLHILP